MKIKRVFAVQLLSFLLLGILLVWVARTFPVISWIAQAQAKIATMGDWAPVLYALLIALCNLLLLPGGLLSIGGGLFFGLWWGFGVNLTGHLLGATAAFWIGRGLGRQRIERRTATYAKWHKLDHAIERQGPRLIFFTQVHPLFPTSLLNYLYGVTRIKARCCLLWLAVGQAPGLFLYSYLGTLTQYGINLALGKTHPPWNEYVVWIGGLLLTLIVMIALGTIALRILRDVNADDLPDEAPVL
jgi:uncharacterized membrane protein YdjX (TVP38/TMEM64 family)